MIIATDLADHRELFGIAGFEVDVIKVLEHGDYDSPVAIVVAEQGAWIVVDGIEREAFDHDMVDRIVVDFASELDGIRTVQRAI